MGRSRARIQHQHHQLVVAVKPNARIIVRNANVASATRHFGFEKLADYRLYSLDGVNKVASAEWIEADDDEAAIEVATEMLNGYRCELWQDRRLIARLDLRDHG